VPPQGSNDFAAARQYDPQHRSVSRCHRAETLAVLGMPHRLNSQYY